MQADLLHFMQSTPIVFLPAHASYKWRLKRQQPEAFRIFISCFLFFVAYLFVYWISRKCVEFCFFFFFKNPKKKTEFCLLVFFYLILYFYVFVFLYGHSVVFFFFFSKFYSFFCNYPSLSLNSNLSHVTDFQITIKEKKKHSFNSLSQRRSKATDTFINTRAKGRD